MLSPAYFESSVVQGDSLIRSGLVEGESALSVDESYETLFDSISFVRLGEWEGETDDVLVGNVADLLKDTASNRVANLLGRRFRMNISKISTPSRQPSTRRALRTKRTQFDCREEH